MNEKNTPGEPTAGSKERLTFRTFLAESLSSLFGVDSGFFYTFRMLLFKPWRVVRDYIHGARARYMDPISMMLALMVYTTVFSMYFDVNSHIFELFVNVSYESEQLAASFGDKLLRMWYDIINSQQVAYLMLCPPVICGVYLAYFKAGSRRFSLTEYCVAAIYMLCVALIYDFIYMLLVCMGTPTLWTTYVLSALLLGVAIVTLLKVFHVQNVFKRILLLLWCMFLVLVCLLIYYSCWLMLMGGTGSMEIAVSPINP